MLETRIDALDFLAQLGEEIVSDYTATDETITTIVTALLAMQVNTTPITLGTIEPTVTRSIEVQAGATVLDIISKLRDTIGGYISVNTSRQLDWLNDIGEDKGQQIRYKKNVKGLSRILEFSNFGNRLYLYGEGEGEARIKLSDATDTKVLGTDTIGTVNLALNVINYAKFTASAGIVTGIKVYSLVSGNVKVAIFADSSGEPGALIKANNTGQAVTLNQWNTLVINDVYLAAGVYWLAIISDTTGAISRNASAGARRWKAAVYAGYTFPSTAGAGFTSTAEEIAISGYYVSTEDYIQDTISQAEYGVCIKQLVDKSITHPDTLLSWGIIKLSEMRLPRATYTVDMVNLEAFGWTFESLQLGSIVKVIDEDLGIDIEARIVKVIRDLSNPQNIKVEISNVLKDIIDTMGGVRDTLQFQNHIATKIGAGQVYVLGGFTVIDWVTGGTTNIKGDYVRTGHLESTNWAVGAGSQFDLDAGTFKLGGSAAPKLSWDGATLTVTGAIYATSGEFTGTLKVTNIEAGKTLTVNGDLRSANYVLNTSGWKIDGAGNAELNSATIRGTLYTSSIASGNILTVNGQVRIKGTGLTFYTAGGVYKGYIGGLAGGVYLTADPGPLFLSAMGVDMSGSYYLNLPRKSSNPDSLAEGFTWWDTVNHVWKCYDGTTVKTLSWT